MSRSLPTIAEEDREREQAKKREHKNETEKLRTKIMQLERDFRSLNEEREELQKQLSKLKKAVAKAQRTLAGTK